MRKRGIEYSPMRWPCPRKLLLRDVSYLSGLARLGAKRYEEIEVADV
jgi:hypothetical protein